MNKVVALRRQDLSFDYQPGNGRPAPREIGFLIGVAVSLVLPQAILCSYYGLLLLLVLGACASLGVTVGVTIHQLLPYRIIKCIPHVMPQAPESQRQRFKLAA